MIDPRMKRSSLLEIGEFGGNNVAEAAWNDLSEPPMRYNDDYDRDGPDSVELRHMMHPERLFHGHV